MSKNKLNQYVVFKLGKEFYSINIEHIVRILSNEKIRSVPNTSEEIKGIIHTEEDIAPVIDLRIKFNIHSAQSEEDPYIIICRVHEYIVGLIVDEVVEVIEILNEKEEIKEINLGNVNVRGKSTEYIQGVYRPNRNQNEEETDEELFIVLNVNKLLEIETVNEIEQIRNDFEE